MWVGSAFQSVSPSIMPTSTPASGATASTPESGRAASTPTSAPASGKGNRVPYLYTASEHPLSPRLNPTDAGMISSRAVLLRKLSMRCLTSCSFMTPGTWYRFSGTGDVGSGRRIRLIELGTLCQGWYWAAAQRNRRLTRWKRRQPGSPGIEDARSSTAAALKVSLTRAPRP